MRAFQSQAARSTFFLSFSINYFHKMFKTLLKAHFIAMFETECAPCRHRISKARENVAWALYVFYFLKDTYADVGPYSYSILKQSEAKPKK